MVKLIILVLGLVVGFGGGVWWGVQHPEQAKQLAEEEKRFLQEQLRIAKETKARIDKIAASTERSSGSRGDAPGSSFVAGNERISRSPDPVIADLRDDQDKQIRELEQKLAEVE